MNDLELYFIQNYKRMEGDITVIVDCFIFKGN